VTYQSRHGNDVIVSAQIAGRIEQLFVREDDVVKKGQLAALQPALCYADLRAHPPRKIHLLRNRNVRQWTFRPATLGDQPVPVVVNLVVNFRSADEVK
jgi:hypothetical protein